MKLYSENKEYKLYQGSMLDMLEVIEPNTIDSIVTDPPYELNFMGKGWDNAGVSFNKDTWEKCYEVLKPGGYLLAFGGSRTYHRIAVAIEDAGFEIRDTIMWLYGSGFPKSMNIGLAIDKKNGVESIDTGEKIDSMSSLGVMHDDNWKSNKDITRKIATNEWQGWGTCLKPSFEPIIVARKTFKGSLVDNVIEYGVGGINIDECRVEPTGEDIGRNNHTVDSPNGIYNFTGLPPKDSRGRYEGRFPANTILTYDETDFDSTSWLRYFYCAKASKKDRDEGLDEFEEKMTCVDKHYADEYKKDVNACNGKYNATQCPKKNIHPTVKPTELMQYLIRLVTPDGGTILDPFNGSGSTGKAVMYENKEKNKNYKYIGIELTEEYLPIAQARIEYVCNNNSSANSQIIQNITDELDDWLD